MTDLAPSLGGVVCDWMEANLVHGPGDVQGHPYRLTDEQRHFVWRAYELRSDGRRRYRRAVYSRRKGTAKTEQAAAIACCELLGPARFGGWGDDGEPIGTPVTAPDIPCVATAEDQAELVYGAVRVMLTEGALADEVDAGLERINLVGRPGRLYLVTSRSSSRDGARPTFTPMDESHLWSTPDLLNLHRTLRRNLGKREQADPWSLETTTAYRPGEGSVAEGSHEYGQRVAAGELEDPTLLFDHLEASDKYDLTTDEGLRAAITEASGEALAWTNLEAIVDDFRDPQTDEADSRRFWLNQVVKAADQWLDPDVWAACGRAQAKVEPGTKIAMGFDGSLYDDATVLIGCRLEDGLLFVLGVWEKPAGRAALGWEVPRGEVDAAVHAALETFDVAMFYVDPPYWQAELDRWSSERGGTVRAWWTNRDRQMALALERLHTAAMTGDLAHDADPTLARHVGNARVRETRAGVLIRKERPRSHHKIDAAVAATLAFEARADAVAAGALKPEPSRAAIFLLASTCPVRRAGLGWPLNQVGAAPRKRTPPPRTGENQPPGAPRAGYKRDPSLVWFSSVPNRKGEHTMPTEVEHLRRELRDTRYLVEAVLMSLVGKDKMRLWEMEAHVQASLRREKEGTPLAEVGIRGRTHDWLTSRYWDGQDVQTVEELVRRWPRWEVAAMEGVGRKTLEKIDAVIAGRGLLEESWAEGEVA